MERYEKEHIERLRPYLAECTVLLKKDGSFPLDAPCRIAAYGSGVRYTVKGGTGSGEVNSRYFVTVEQGLKDAGFDVVSEEWAYQYSQYAEYAKKQYIDEVRAKAKEEKVNIIAASMGAVMKQPEYHIPMDFSCDAAIYVVSRISGEGNDRLAEKGDFMLTDSEVRDILALDSHYERFMLVINAGGPVDLTPVMGVRNILVLSQLGVETGAALADILLGKACPSGKLTTTWSAYGDYCSEGDFGERDDTRYREGIYTGYRYFDSFGKKPLFPFGYGLGYTEFRAGKASVKADGPQISVSAKIRNSGRYRGKETLQVYVSCPPGIMDRELKSLAGFAKTAELAPGEEETLRVSFDIRELAAFDEDSASYLLEKGDYIVLAGTSGADAVPAAVLRLDEDFTVRQSERLFAGADFSDMKSSPDRDFDVSRLKPLKLDLSGCETLRPAGREVIRAHAGEPALSEMSASDLAYLNTGNFDTKKLLQSVIGDSAQRVAGAAGQSTAMFSDKGIDSIVMSDGPAGIRISRHYYEDKGGRHPAGFPIPERIMEMLPDAMRDLLERIAGPKKGAEIKEQYCTALPVETAIAQSWNTDFAEMCGDIAGTEMELFGIDLWLAPALNIHRNVLCGRNFEYLSEDPLLSGKFAAALVRGAQKHRGCGAVIKHYAANSQETNRYASNSIVSERALREIYLKGFGICIRESGPVAVMTSYNLLNGRHTSESLELTRVLREEFSFDGLVMTDWVTGGTLLLKKGSKYSVPDPALVAAAGCSLFMPGGRGDLRKIMKGLREGRVTEEQLRENAGWFIHVLRKLGRQ